MAKEKKEKTGKAKETNAPNLKPKQEPDEEKPFHFGGLPQRDLKKNLGCG